MTLEDYLVRNRSNTFLLRVRGDSMINAGIQEGDLVLVERGVSPRVADIVVGVLDGEFTLKRLKRGMDSEDILQRFRVLKANDAPGARATLDLPPAPRQ